MNRLAMIAALGALSVAFGYGVAAGAAEPGVAGGGAAACAGTWKFEMVGERSEEVVMKLAQDGDHVTGKAAGQNGEVDVSGTCKGGDVELSETVTSPFGDGEMQIDFVGKVTGKSMSGIVIYGTMGQGKFTAKKQ